MSLYTLEFLETAAREFDELPRRLKELFCEKAPYLVRGPYRSLPWLRVRQGTRHPNEWRFHLEEFRVFYRVDGLSVVITRIVPRPRAYPSRPPKRPRTRRLGRVESDTAV